MPNKIKDCAISTELDKALGSVVRGLIAERKYNVKNINKCLGLSTATLYKKLRGETPFTVKEAAILCHNLEFDIEELIQRANALLEQKNITFSKNRISNYWEARPNKIIETF